MKGFTSYGSQLKELIEKFVKNEALHARWLKTLSYLEYCGARKIAACHHPSLVRKEVLKHAAEEFRHAHYLRLQMEKLSLSESEIKPLQVLGGMATLHYLPSLDLQICRYLSRAGFSGGKIREAAYILVTYAIEFRAGELYPIYDAVLREASSKVKVRSILLEEEEHLEEMQRAILTLPSGPFHAEACRYMESKLCAKWVNVLENSINFACNWPP